MPSTDKGPLAKIRVLDLGTMVAGPVACTLLADFGADVIKIEQPAGGDTMRQIGPFVDGESLWWNVEGRNKRSVTIDLRVKDGQHLLVELAKSADVIVENFRPGTLDRWNLGYARLKAANPNLVLLSVSGFGHSGPNAPRAAYDRIAQAFSGFLNMTGFPDRPPVRPGTAVADYQSALYGAFAVMLALFHRAANGGGGQHIDLSLYESMFRFTDIMVPAFDRLAMPRERRGNLHFAAAPGDHFPTMDGRYLVLSVSGNGVYRRLCNAMGRPDLIEAPSFKEHEDRWRNIVDLNAIVARWIVGTPTDEVCAALEREAVPHGIVYTVEDILKDPHYAARGSVISVDNPRIGPVKMPGVFPRFSGFDAPTVKVAPTLGEHTDEVLAGLGIEPRAVDRLRAANVI